MAPANGATGRPGQGTPRRPAGGPHKPVVPAIPLPYLQRQRRNLSTAVNTRPFVNEQHVSTETANELDLAGAQPNRGGTRLDEIRKTAINHHHTMSPATLPQNQAQRSEPEAVGPSATPAKSATTANDRLAAPPSEPSSKKGADTLIAHNPATYVQQPVASPASTQRRAGSEFDTLDASQHHRPDETGPGPFHQSGGNHHRLTSTDQAGFHQVKANNGNVALGGLHDSNNSSPVPLGGGVQPPNSTSYQPEGPAVSGLDGFRRPFIVSPSFDGFPPDAFPPPIFHQPHQRHGPPTPHSFHGSQSSTHADEKGYHTYPLSGQYGYPAHSGGQAHRHMDSMSLDPQSGVHFSVTNGPATGCAVSRLQAQVLDYLRGGIDRAEFSDCMLEVHLVNPHQPRDSPLLIPCHRFIIAQSPMLNQTLRSSDRLVGGRLVLEVQDQYMRSDTFHLTLRTLYGWDLGDGPLPPYLPHQSVKDGFDLALGYAAAASYLKLPFVYAKAINQACHQLHWETIEKACQFALPRVVIDQSSQHGADSFTPLALISAIMVFLIHSIPADFVLDVQADDSGFSRLPRTSAFVAPGRVGPAIAHGTSRPREESPHRGHGSAFQAHMPRTSRLSANPRLSSIQFGDLSLTNGNDALSGRQVGTVRPRSPSHTDTLLSRILLNLPFPMLKQVLEHPDLAKPSGDLSLPSRQKLISSVVAEREARRLSALNKGDPQLEVFLAKLESASEPLEVQQMGDFMVNSLGFKEEVFSGDVPFLVRTWVHGSGSVSA